MKYFSKKLIIGLIIIACLTPIGIFFPKLFHAGSAWGEWSLETVQKKTGYIPSGMKKEADIWKAPIADYGNKSEKQSNQSKILTYILSGFAGIAIISIVTFVLLKVAAKND
jgi:cobalt/nickel transport system permease protein/cobalt/nickel transport protein